MADKDTKRYMEMQMDEMKDFHSENNEEKDSTPKKRNDDREKHAEVAKLYEDLAEYEEDLKCFEDELEVVNANELKDIAASLTQKLPDEERDYEKELKAVLEAGWTFMVEVQKTHPKEQLDLIKDSDLSDVVEKFNSTFTDYVGDFETDVRNILVKRWETLIAIKKEHIKEEITEIKTLGLKPNYVKRAYKIYHGIE